MKATVMLIAAAAVASAGCNRSADETAANNAQPPVASTENAAQSVIPPPETGPDARTPLAEPKGPIDPKSVEAAGQVVQSYGALIEQKRWDEANALWGDRAAAANLQSELSRNPQVHLSIGDLGATEGAAGSIYTTVPIVVYGDTFRRPADVVLRRVNDVPGSTEAQRRWHIERIEWKKAD